MVGLKATDLGRAVTINGRAFTISGMKSSGKILVTDAAGKVFKADPSVVKARMAG
jgi:hypothetical protein